MALPKVKRTAWTPPYIDYYDSGEGKLRLLFVLRNIELISDSYPEWNWIADYREEAVDILDAIALDLMRNYQIITAGSEYENWSGEMEEILEDMYLVGYRPQGYFPNFQEEFSGVFRAYIFYYEESAIDYDEAKNRVAPPRKREITQWGGVLFPMSENCGTPYQAFSSSSLGQHRIESPFFELLRVPPEETGLSQANMLGLMSQEDDYSSFWRMTFQDLRDEQVRIGEPEDDGAYHTRVGYWLLGAQFNYYFQSLYPPWSWPLGSYWLDNPWTYCTQKENPVWIGEPIAPQGIPAVPPMPMLRGAPNPILQIGTWQEHPRVSKVLVVDGKILVVDGKQLSVKQWLI